MSLRGPISRERARDSGARRRPVPRLPIQLPKMHESPLKCVLIASRVAGWVEVGNLNRIADAVGDDFEPEMPLTPDGWGEGRER